MRFAVFGSPVEHSLSPVMHRAVLKHYGIPGDYDAREVDAAGLRAGIGSLRRGELDGANVTMPYKIAAYDACDFVSPEAKSSGAVNTLAMHGGTLTGANTDVGGIRAVWAAAQLPTDQPVAVLGAGGAAAGALVALAGRKLIVVARDSNRARAMLDRTGVSADVVPWDKPLKTCVVVNATPIGMRGEMIPSHLLDAATGLLDMAYGDTETPAVAAVRARNLPLADGVDVLVAQAALSFAVWTGIEPETQIMRTAANRELIRRRQHEEAL